MYKSLCSILLMLLGTIHIAAQPDDVLMREQIDEYLIEARRGDPEAQYNLGLCYIHGNGVDMSYEEAAKWLEKAAKQGHADAQYNLGVSYLKGQGVRQDYTEAVKWFSLAANKGNVDAMYNLATSYMNGEGTEQNIEQAIALYEQASAKGHVKAQRVLGDCYFFGMGIPKDFEKAVEWYTLAAENGDAARDPELGVEGLLCDLHSSCIVRLCRHGRLPCHPGQCAQLQPGLCRRHIHKCQLQ